MAIVNLGLMRKNLNSCSREDANSSSLAGITAVDAPGTCSAGGVALDWPDAGFRLANAEVKIRKLRVFSQYLLPAIQRWNPAFVIKYLANSSGIHLNN
jgi:hypothetical protein